MKKIMALLAIIPFITSLTSCVNQNKYEVGVFNPETNTLTFDFSKCYTYSTISVTDENNKKHFIKQPDISKISSNFFDSINNIFTIPSSIDDTLIYNYQFIGVEEDFILDDYSSENYQKNYFQDIKFKFEKNDNIKIVFDNISIKSLDKNYPVIDLSLVNNAKIHFNGVNEIYHESPKSSLIANDLELSGNSINSYLKIKRYDVLSVPEPTIKCSNLIIQDVDLDIYGANNFNSSDDPLTLKGGDAIETDKISVKFSTVNLYSGNGGTGLNGNETSPNGTVGGDTGYCLNLRNPTKNVKGSKLIKLHGGNGGTGGVGAIGVKGSDGSDAVNAFFIGHAATPGNQGGQGGLGGDGGNSFLTNNIDPHYFSIISDGEGGLGGQGGQGGPGGNGGKPSDYYSVPGQGGPGGLGGKCGNNGLNWKGEKNPTVIPDGPTGNKGNPGSN